jgi:hypothetical protein
MRTKSVIVAVLCVAALGGIVISRWAESED